MGRTEGAQGRAPSVVPATDRLGQASNPRRPGAFCNMKAGLTSPDLGSTSLVADNNDCMEASSLARPGAPRGIRVAPRLLARLSDERLVEQLRRGNDAAFEVIYDRHHRGILAFCRHMLGSHEEAEDAVQHTFISAHDSLLRSDRPIQLKPWLYTI